MTRPTRQPRPAAPINALDLAFDEAKARLDRIIRQEGMDVAKKFFRVGADEGDDLAEPECAGCRRATMLRQTPDGSILCLRCRDKRGIKRDVCGPILRTQP